MSSRRHRSILTVMLTLAACSSDDASVSTQSADSLPAVTSITAPADEPLFVPGASAPESTTASTSTTTTTLAATTTTTTTTTTSTTTLPATTTTTTLPAGTPVAGEFDLGSEHLVLGTSVEGRPLTADRYGTLGGRRVLVIGVIHGNEDAGVAVLDELRLRASEGSTPPDVELWLVESMNPDGQAAQIRQNANGVDLNRNFPHEWGPIGQPGDSQYAGPAAASEPETQAMINFISQLAPDIAIWYHQDANLIIPSTGRQGRIRERYAELTGLPLAECCSGGGVYTGIAATWARVALSAQEAVPFIVELPGGDLTTEQVMAHATAVETIAAEG